MFDRLRTSLLALTLLAPALSQADQLLLRNGDRLSGTVVQQSEKTLLYKTTYAGELKIDWAEVAELTTDQPVTVLLRDETLQQARHFSAAPQPGAVATADVSHINPPPELSGRGYSVSGRINVGSNQTAGNTDTQNYHVDAEGVFRAKRYRITLAADYNRASSGGVKSVDNATVSAKYDRFLTERWYVYGLTRFHHDKFLDLRLRRDLGLGIGHVFIAEEDRKLDLELGLTQQDEDFYLAPDQQDLSLRWAANFEQRFFSGLLTLFHNHELLVPTDAADDFFLATKTGVRVPVADSLATTFQINVDYDNAPMVGNKHTDMTYLFTLGYSW